MIAGRKTLEKRGFIFYEDSQFYTFKREELGVQLFDQIQIRLDTKTVKCATYTFTSNDGFKESALTLDEELMTAIILVLRELKKEKKEGDKC